MVDDQQRTIADVERAMDSKRPIGECVLPLRRLRRDGRTQLRVSMNLEATTDYAEALERGERFPPVMVFDDGDSFWLSDGFHRYDAHVVQQREMISCEVRQGTRQEAIVYSATANRAHGVRLTAGDREKIVMTLVSEFPAAGVVEIARLAEIPHNTVSRILKRLGCPLDNSKGGPKPKPPAELQPTPIETALADVPEEQRDAIEELLTAPLVPPDLALEAAQNVAAMPEEQRERVAELAASKDATDRSAAVALMRGIPHVDPAWPLVSVSLEDLKKAMRVHEGKELQGAFRICIQHVEGLLEAIESYERSKTDAAA